MARKKSLSVPVAKEEAPAIDFRNLTEEQKTILFKFMFTGKLPRHKLKPRVATIDESAHPLAISREMFDSMMRIATYFAARGNWRTCRELVSEAFTPISRSDYFSSPSYGVAIHYAEVAEYDLRKNRDETVGQMARNALTMRYVRARLALYIRALRLEYRNSPEFT
jgi:hypothetical protein